MGMTLESNLKRLGRRDWGELLDLCVEFIPKTTMPVVDPLTVNALPDLQTIPGNITETEARSTKRDHYFQVGGLHPAMLSEAVVLFYKSLNVVGCTHLELDNGFKTWGVASAYHSSYFSAKCLLNILGVNFARVGDLDLIIDILPSYSDQLRKKEIERRKSTFECRILRSNRLEHWEVWLVLQRILRTLTSSILSSSSLKLILNLEPKEFARQRNRIVYHNTFWLYEDLRDRIVDPDFGCKSIDRERDEAEADGLTLLISFLLLNYIHKLLSSLADRVPSFKLEFDPIKVMLESGNFRRYDSFVKANQFDE